ncbi:uncharacterized protein LTR77_003257 [Saxophila tyrrhenica]|uniref:DUF6594 domain-containing protein n=1 Tax=Saxophila tyrrhenica TaxID=1690608 RepID=A0AAV9PKH0_9PEZI|nr:hypothetical protein LTR77_003257 [Saxophila tyrrhenica]
MTGSMSSMLYTPQSARARAPQPSAPTEDEIKAGDSWHHLGYPAFVRWMASSNDFFVLRRFSRLSARCLLYQQNEIARLEKDLDDWDDLARKTDPDDQVGRLSSDRIEQDPLQERAEILRQLIPLLKAYYDSVNSFAEVKARPTARRHHIRNLENWFKTYPNAIDPEEQHFRRGDQFLEGDLFPIISKQQPPLRLALGQWRWLRFQFQLRPRDDRIGSDQIIYTSEKGLDLFTNMLVLVLGLLLLFAPMWWLNFVVNDVHRLAVITSFVAAFTGVVWAAAGQRPFEILAATAAYAAVLMVFLQSNNSQSRLGGSSAVKAMGM